MKKSVGENKDAPMPSPEVKAIIKKFVEIQKEKYGDDWKEKLSAEMAASTTPFLLFLRDLGKATNALRSDRDSEATSRLPP